MAHLTRTRDALSYAPPGHHGVAARRLQGAEVTPSQHLVVGVSTYPPAAHVDWLPTAVETVYVCLQGRLTVRTADEEYELTPMDSVLLDAGELRSVDNLTDEDAQILVVLAAPCP